MSKIDDIKFQKLGEKERLLLLNALDLHPFALICYYCEEKVSYKDCCIMPSIDKDEKARITCGSLLCIAEYIEEFEEDNLELNEKTKNLLIKRINKIKTGEVMSTEELMKRLTRKERTNEN